MSSSAEVGKVKNFTKKENLSDFIYYLTAYAHSKYFRSLDVTLSAYKADAAVTQTYCFWVSEPLQLSDTLGNIDVDLWHYVCAARGFAIVIGCCPREPWFHTAWKGRRMYVITPHYLSLAWCKPSRWMV